MVNIESTFSAIQKAAEEAELMAEVEIDSAYVGIAGGHIKGFNSHGMVAVKEREVTKRDIERAIDYGCNKIIIMRNDHDKKINRPKHWFTRLTRSEGFLVNELTEAKIQLARLNNVNCEIVELKINKSLPNINTEHFKSPDDIKRAIDYGYEAAVKILK